jgi:hypothetical protein
MISIMDEASFALEMGAAPMDTLQDDFHLIFGKYAKKGLKGGVEKASHISHRAPFPVPLSITG